MSIFFTDMGVHIRLCGCAVLLLSSASCITPVHPPASPQAPPESVSIQAFSDDPFLSAPLPSSPMHSHQEAIKALGQPQEVLTKDAPSEHDPKIVNSLTTLRYAFGDLVYLQVVGKDVENLILIQLHASKVPLKYGIKIGKTTRAQVLGLFGQPQDREDNSFTYTIPSTQEITNTTTFYFRDAVLLEVDISSDMLD